MLGSGGWGRGFEPQGGTFFISWASFFSGQFLQPLSMDSPRGPMLKRKRMARHFPGRATLCQTSKQFQTYPPHIKRRRCLGGFGTKFGNGFKGKILKFFKKDAVPSNGTTSIFDDFRKEDMH